MNYTEEQLEEAKAYLKDRLRNQRSMSADVIRLLELYAGYLLTALSGNATDYDIQTLVNDLIEQLITDMELLAVDEHDRKDAILAYIGRDIDGGNVRGRIRGRVDTFFDEVFTTYVAGKVLGHDYAEILSVVKENMKDPWKNPIIEEAREASEGGGVTMPDGIDLSMRHYGQGVPVSSLDALINITEHTVAVAWDFFRHITESYKGAKGYFRVRMSDYDCPLCDEWCGVFYPITDTEHMGPRHVHCVCATVFSYIDRL